MDKKKLIFVYNAKSGYFHALGGLIHKTVSPSTYACNLCALTYHGTKMNEEWKDFIKKLNIAVEFLHKDEFLKLYKKDDIKFPSAFIKTGEKTDLFIKADEINSCKSLEELIGLVKKKIDKEISKLK